MQVYRHPPPLLTWMPPQIKTPPQPRQPSTGSRWNGVARTALDQDPGQSLRWTIVAYLFVAAPVAPVPRTPRRLIALELWVLQCITWEWKMDWQCRTPLWVFLPSHLGTCRSSTSPLSSLCCIINNNCSSTWWPCRASRINRSQLDRAGWTLPCTFRAIMAEEQPWPHPCSPLRHCSSSTIHTTSTTNTVHSSWRPACRTRLPFRQLRVMWARRRRAAVSAALVMRISAVVSQLMRFLANREAGKRATKRLYKVK